MISQSASASKTGIGKGFLPGVRSVFAVGWGQFTDSQIKNVARFYSVCPDEVAEFLGGRLLNFGLWETGQEDHQTAARALVHEVARMAQVGPGESVLDVGCGFGGPALIFHLAYGAEEVVGINVTPCQLDYASRVAEQQGVGTAVRFVKGDATAVPLEDGQFDHVIALESAFHFSPREAFFREAWRVLRPGGCLTVADVIPKRPDAGRMLKLLAARLWLFPAANDYGPEGYVRRLTQSGFGQIEFRSIERQVYPDYVRWTLAPENLPRLRRLLGWSRAQVYIWQTQLLGTLARRGFLGYGLVRGVKESAPSDESPTSADKAPKGDDEHAQQRM